MWISKGLSHCLCHGGQPRFGQPSATGPLLAPLAGSRCGTVASSLWDLTKRKRTTSSSLFLNLRGCIMYTPPGLAPLFWLPWWLYFLESTSSCWIVTAYRLPCLKLKTCGQRPTWRVFQPIVRVAFHRHTLYEPSHVTAKTLRLSTHNLGLVVLEWVKRLWSSQNHMRNSTLGSL